MTEDLIALTPEEARCRWVVAEQLGQHSRETCALLRDGCLAQALESFQLFGLHRFDFM